MPERPHSCPPCSIRLEARRRLGRVDDGSAITDYDEEEIARKMSIATGLAFVEWGKPDAKVKINLLDTPGFNMFVHEAKMVLPVGGRGAGGSGRRGGSGGGDAARLELLQRRRFAG